MTIQAMVATNTPQVVTANLVQWIDSKNYSGSGSTWNAYYGGNGTLYNTPTYTSADPTYFRYATASSQYATIPDLGNISRFTVEAWFRPTSVPISANPYATSIVANYYNGSVLNFSLGTNNAPTDYNIGIGFFDGSWRRTAGFTPTANTWYFVSGNYDGSYLNLYVNGVLNTQQAYSSLTPTSGGVTRIACRWDDQSNALDFFPGDIATVRIYNAALTAAQVQQNYMAERSRFGL